MGNTSEEQQRGQCGYNRTNTRESGNWVQQVNRKVGRGV